MSSVKILSRRLELSGQPWTQLNQIQVKIVAKQIPDQQNPESKSLLTTTLVFGLNCFNCKIKRSLENLKKRDQYIS